MSIEFTRIKWDVNGNPRYVCSYLHLLTEQEKSAPVLDEQGRRIAPTKYEIAVKRSHKLGGRKYHTRAYGGGIVFQSYNIRELERDIEELVREESGT